MTTETLPVDTQPRRRRGPDRPLSVRQVEALRFIAARVRDGLPSPTFAEIGAAIGTTSKSVVNFHLGRLKARGLIEPGEFAVPRSLRITDRARAEYPEMFPLSPAERVLEAVQDARDAGEPLPARVDAALEAVA